MKTLFLRFSVPDSGVIDLAPRVEGKGQYIGEKGYAIAISNHGVKVFWDDGGSDWCGAEELLFYSEV